MVRALWDGERFGPYRLHAFVVMPTMSNLLVAPHVTARQWLGPLKGFTGHAANRLLGRSGAFWQDESYDHLVRDSESDLALHRVESRQSGVGGNARGVSLRGRARR